MSVVSKIFNVRTKHDAGEVSVDVKYPRMFLNTIGCFMAVYVYFYMLLYSERPLTLDILFSIFLAELCRWANAKRRSHPDLQEVDDNPGMLEKGHSGGQKVDSIAAIVGYREDPELFTRALKSYLDAEHCRFILVSIDGDDTEDQEMINVFKKVYPDNSAKIHFDLPFAEVALQMDRARTASTTDDEIISKCVTIAKNSLQSNNIVIRGKDAVTRLCVSQPHMHKKGIMFTSFIVSLAIAEILGIEMLWSSDSDSLVFPDTLSQTMATFAADPKIGGASTSLFVHNKDETILTQLGSAVYLNEQYLARSFTGAASASDCQSGPCAAFPTQGTEDRTYYLVVNEDRHLTTCLLRKGWRVVYVSDVFACTDTPTTLRRWLLQQVRWSRSVHVESFHRPSVYVMQSPILFFASLKREFEALIMPVTVLLYVTTGFVLFKTFSFQDYFRRRFFTLLYLSLRNPYRPAFVEWLWSIPGNLFYTIPLPAILTWSLVTVLHDSWGTTMRSSKELSTQSSKLRLKIWEVGFFVLWMGILGGATGRFIGGMFMLDPTQISVCVLLGAVPLWALFTLWMVIAE
ncbi:hypothetical protein DID88_008754 [Monilinia fructigena]|uniref:Glycosyltransferase 2-like domain-containing protein n=1 Tax=Monilinia fructigena TaxID=38457 RepID=A0A395J6R7_9HELO|nr:hypothetical protein DID88_008754 [Monilinia fructigena]